MAEDTLTEQQIHAIETSFAALAPRGEELVKSFYERLFSNYPEVKPMFDGSLPEEQRKKLLASLVLVVENLRRPEKLGPALDQLGRRHEEIGATEPQYAAVGQTLLETIASFAGDLWDQDLQDAWTQAYAVISQRMLAAQAVTATA